MKKIAQLAGQELHWAGCDDTPGCFTLFSRADPAAVLQFTLATGPAATATCADGCWEFRRAGRWGTDIAIRDAESHAELALLRHYRQGDARLETCDGTRYRLNSNLLRTDFAIVAEDGAPIVHVKGGGIVRMEADIAVGETGPRPADLPWLVLLGWYCAVSVHRDLAEANSAAGPMK